jgi:uncharacterized membrane protein
MLLALEAIVCFTPLGSLPAFGPIVATLSHIPVILAAILLGIEAGIAMGFFFGLFSFMVWTFIPPAPPIAFIFTPLYSFGNISGNFWSLVICFLPRILIGFVTGISFKFSKKMFSNFDKTQILTYSLAGILGSLTNTFLVLGGIYFFFGNEYSTTIGIAKNLLLGIIGMSILTSGIPEAIVGAILAYAIGKPLNRLINNAKA